MTPNRVDEPMTYTVETGCTCEQATTLANEAGWILDQWTGHDTDSTLNLQRSLAAPFLRSHPECAYVYQGPGGTGKSTLAKDLMEHLGDQATTMSLDLLAQPTAMSAENKMGDLMSHLLALSDDYDPTHGRFEKSLPNLKTLLTGLLPFSARRQGVNSVDGIERMRLIWMRDNHPRMTTEMMKAGELEDHLKYVAERTRQVADKYTRMLIDKRRQRGENDSETMAEMDAMHMAIQEVVESW